MPPESAADPWRALALETPRAFGETPVSGALRVEAADFRVEERLGFEPDGGVAHRLLLVEKEMGRSSRRFLAARAGRPSGDIGFAGQKDRRAIALILGVGRADTASLRWLTGEGFRVLADTRIRENPRRPGGQPFRIRADRG
jgi:hypothetical protein